jgi:hypothetical protein
MARRWNDLRADRCVYSGELWPASSRGLYSALAGAAIPASTDKARSAEIMTFMTILPEEFDADNTTSTAIGWRKMTDRRSS